MHEPNEYVMYVQRIIDGVSKCATCVPCKVSGMCEHTECKVNTVKKNYVPFKRIRVLLWSTIVFPRVHLGAYTKIYYHNQGQNIDIHFLFWNEI